MEWFLFSLIDEIRGSVVSIFQYPLIKDSMLRVPQYLHGVWFFGVVHIFEIFLCWVTLDKGKKMVLAKSSDKGKVLVQWENRDLNRKVFSPCCLHVLSEKDWVCNIHQVWLCFLYFGKNNKGDYYMISWD